MRSILREITAKQPALRTELLLNLAFLAAVALLLGAVSSLVVNAVAPERVFAMVLVVVGLDVAIFIVFGHYLVTRLVLRPMGRLVAAADAVIAGDLAARAPDAETRDFAMLSERLNRMTDHLLDAQGHMVRAEKLASVGRVASGIAHEIGNPLGAIGTYVDVLRRRGAEGEIVDGMQRELNRIDAIIRSLLDYARPGSESLDTLDPVTLIREAYELLDAQGTLKQVQAALDLPGDVPAIRARAALFQQAVVNLLLNAIEAAPGGTVVVGARRWAYQPRHTGARRATDPALTTFSRDASVRPTRVEFSADVIGTLIFVADAGPGVPRADRARIFEPFFTTKSPGLGTGLGLALVSRAVEGMGGVIWVDTAREGGAAFKMFFPAAGGAA